MGKGEPRFARGRPEHALSLLDASPLPPLSRLLAALPRRAEFVSDLPTGEWPAPAESGGETAVRTLLWVELETSLAALRRLRDLVARYGGTEVENGDALLALFARPVDAVACALAGAGAGGPFLARTALHLGEVLLLRPSAAEVSQGARPLEALGAAKKRVALLGKLARPGQILLTQGVFDLARQAGRDASSGFRWLPAGAEPALRWLAHGTYRVDADEEDLEVFEVGAAGLAPLAAPADSPLARRRLSASEEHLLGWRPAIGQPIPRRPLWRLAARLAEGGFGEVWLARHPSGERRVFKFCFLADKLRALRREVTLFRLLKEALGHRDDIARILDWHFEEPPYFVESEYTEGGDLASWAQQQGGLGAVPMVTRLALAAEIAEALAAAHSVGVLHKDVKPENILVQQDREGKPRARLTDFGIGQLTERDKLEAGGLTAMGFTGTLGESDTGKGTLGYLAPELVEGKAPSVRTDIYSFGVLLYQLAAGDLERTLAPGWERNVGDEILSEDIAALVDGQPERRPAGALEVAAGLRSLEERREARAREKARQLELAKAQRRRRWASLAALFTFLLLVVVTVMGLREYRARQLAEAAQKTALVRQKQAEDLIGFMLGDLRQKLDGVGRLDVLDAVGAQAMSYFAAVPSSELSDEELARRSKALYQIGEVRANQGNLSAARESFEQAATLAAALVARAPEHEESSFELAQAHYWLGITELQQGHAQKSHDHFSEYLKIAEALAARKPEDKKWQLELAYATNCMAAALESLSKLEPALSILERSNQIKASLLELEPGDFEIETSLANGLARKGNLLFRLGRRGDAGSVFETERKLREHLLARDPGNVASIQNLAINRSLLGEMESSRGSHLSAIDSYTAAIALFKTLTDKDSSNRKWRGELLALQVLLGKSQTAARLFAEARKTLQYAASMAKEMAEEDPGNQRWHTRLQQIREARETLASSAAS